ncbi:MAG: hypothetical protein KKG33_15195 [candidate division Zixibacteria bacterium]|nr:hypothetical protein [candidate division Zixibacteria bacterium]
MSRRKSDRPRVLIQFKVTPSKGLVEKVQIRPPSSSRGAERRGDLYVNQCNGEMRRLPRFARNDDFQGFSTSPKLWGTRRSIIVLFVSEDAAQH